MVSPRSARNDEPFCVGRGQDFDGDRKRVLFGDLDAATKQHTSAVGRKNETNGGHCRASQNAHAGNALSITEPPRQTSRPSAIGWCVREDTVAMGQSCGGPVPRRNSRSDKHCHQRSRRTALVTGKAKCAHHAVAICGSSMSASNGLRSPSPRRSLLRLPSLRRSL